VIMVVATTNIDLMIVMINLFCLLDEIENT
jgi:hypothetical protein